jgi:negative regulator of flagellin synthesis FlgM
MKITHRGPADADLSQLVQNDKAIGQAKRGGEQKTESATGSSKVQISQAARELQKIAELGRTGDQLRANKVQQIKDQIDQGTYKPDPIEVAKSIVRTEVSSLLEKK